MSVEIFSRLDYFNGKILKEERLINFVNKVTKGYDRNVTYHNDLHAADVLQTSYVVIRKGETLKVIILNLRQKLSLQRIDILSLLITTIIHDYKHPGFNNVYHINTKSKLAIRYNGNLKFL